MMKFDGAVRWGSGLVFFFTAGVLTVVSLVAEPGGLSSNSLITITIFSMVAGIVHRLLGRQKAITRGLQKISDAFPFGVVIYGPDLSIRFANRYAQAVYGKPLTEIIGRKDEELLSPEAVRMISGELEEVCDDGDVRTTEASLESGGRRKMFLMTFAPTGPADHGQREIISIWFETSKINEMTNRLSRLNRILSTLIQANRALIGRANETELLDRFCHTLHHEGGYGLVWIGAREEDGRIRPVAAAGCESKELKSLGLRWDRATDQSTPLERALLDERPYTANHTEQLTGHADGLAERLDLKSCAGLPVRIGGRSEYGLCLCSDQESGFGSDELELLTQLTDDAGFAIESVRNSEELAHSRESLAQAQRIARLGTWNFDQATSTLRWSRETYRIHSWPQDAPVEISKIRSLIHPADRQKVENAARELLTCGDSMELEYRLILPDKEVRHLYVWGKPILDEAGTVAGITGTVMNVTQQKAAEEENRAFERMLIRFLDNLPAVITLKNERLEHVYGNSAALDLFGTDSEHFVGSTDTAFLTHDTADVLHAVERSALNTRQPVLTPDISVGHNGQQRHLRGLCFPVVRPNGEVQVGMYASDVTELQSATAKTGLLESALEAAANGVVITNKRGDIEWVNQAFTRITGYTSEEAIGNNPRILKSGQHDPKFYKDMWATLLKGQVWNGELKNRHKDGTIYDEQMTITPVRDADDKIAHFIAIKLDVSERNELEAKLLRSQRMESIGMLAGGVAHDLNNILAPIVMGVDLLRSDALAGAEKNEFLDSIASNCERGTGIIRQVLTFARGVEGQRVIVQLRHQVKDIVKMARETFPKDVQISMNVSSNLWPVMGDATQLHQVLLNFSVNGRDAMPHGGKLEFVGENVELADPHTFQGFEIPPGKYTKLSVRDTGTGMPQEVLDRVFEPFFTTKEQGKGTGLGLPTVLGIVKSHRGLVEFVTAPGKGTSAIVWLPAAEHIEESQSDVQAAPPEGEGQTILLVDDEPDVRSMSAAILKKANYNVLTASDGAEAVAEFALRKDEIDLVITDIMMPVMDGAALTHALRSIKPSVRIVGATGFAGDGSRGDRIEELKLAGVQTILQKPFTVRQLLEATAEELAEIPTEIII